MPLKSVPHKPAIICTYLAPPGNGYIPTTCLREILRELDDQLTNEELDMMIEEIDSDGSGTVDFDGTFLDFLFLFFQRSVWCPINCDSTCKKVIYHKIKHITNFKTILLRKIFL